MSVYRFSLSIMFVLLSLTHCASTRPQGDTSSETIDEDLIDNYSLLWKSLTDVAFTYPIQDFSKEEGYIESDWIYKGKQTRYRFFIHIAKGSKNPFEIEIQNQIRKSRNAEWHWHMPSLDIEENLKRAIYETLQKYRSS